MAIIHGEGGQHAQDLIRRQIISHGPTGEHLVIVPITATKKIITDLLDKENISQPRIVNFAGVMITSPNATSNLHFLFGPKAENNLKVVVAGPHTPLVKEILDQAQGKCIRVIETSRTEHDKKMATIQGLAHLLLILVGRQGDTGIQECLIKPWETPPNTVVDMIFENPFAEEIAIEFFESLKSHGHDPFRAFQSIIEKHFSDADRENFSTPNSNRIFAFDSIGIQPLSPDQITRTRNELNTHGRRFLFQEIEAVRSISSRVHQSP